MIGLFTQVIVKDYYDLSIRIIKQLNIELYTPDELTTLQMKIGITKEKGQLFDRK